MTTDPFIEAARTEAERRWPMDAPPVRLLSAAERKDRRIGFEVGARWARTHLTATLTANDSQSDSEPTDAEVAALIDSLAEQAGVFIMPLTASMALQDSRRAARRDEEKRDG